jgi:hypothetical protein
MMDSWLRPVFTRKQTPTLSGDSFSSLGADESHDGEEGMPKLRAASRVSSRISFRSGSPATTAPEGFASIRTLDSVYHKPSIDQMVEMLKVVLMNQSLTSTLPVHYNSCILHVLEDYYDLRTRLQAKEQEIESLRQRHAKDIGEFEEMASGWRMKERDYKTEMKRLEVLLAHTEGGMESLSLARSRSLIHGSKTASEAISKGIGSIKERNVPRNHQDKVTCKLRLLRLLY